MRRLPLAMSLALGLATTAATGADFASTPLRLQLSQSELAAVVSQPEESASNDRSASAKESGSTTESPAPASPTGRTVLHPSPARTGSQPARPSEPVRATADSKSPIACAARTALPWVAVAGALFAAGKAGGNYVEPDFSLLFKEPDAREARDTWRNHAAPTRSAGELPSTLHP